MNGKELKKEKEKRDVLYPNTPKQKSLGCASSVIARKKPEEKKLIAQ